jgi:hypothetical protein
MQLLADIFTGKKEDIEVFRETECIDFSNLQS